MTNMKNNKSLRMLALAIAPLSLWMGGQAQAIPIVSIAPTSQEAAVGDTVSIDINVSGLGPTELVGGFSALLSFDDTILSGAGFILDPDSNMDPIFDLSFGFSGGELDLFFVAMEADLSGQGAGFTLARVTFSAIANGISDFILSVAPSTGIFLSDELGFELPADSANGLVCVGAPCPVTQVPEPGIAVLFSTGLLFVTVGAWRRRRREARA